MSLGLKAGINLSDAKEYTNTYSGVGDKKAKWGYQIGFNLGYAFTNSIYLQSGLSLTTKGTKHEGMETWIGSSNPPVTTWQAITNQTYLQLPLRFGYKINLSDLTKIHMNAGPYIAYGIAGKETITSSLLFVKVDKLQVVDPDILNKREIKKLD